MTILFLVISIYLTFRFGFYQFIHPLRWLTAPFRKADPIDSQNITPFQSLCTALAGTLGTGNIAGVATAITAGGPGALFWMWISALFAMMAGYCENYLGIRYRKKIEGKWIGGAFYYIEKGLHNPVLAKLYGVFCLLAAMAMGNMTQSHSVATGLKNSFGIPTPITGLLLMIIVTYVIFGGIRQIALISEKIVPLMALIYCVTGIIIIFVFRNHLPNVLESVFLSAFGIRPAAGGIGGYAVSRAIQKGIYRGVASNEAGLGTSVMAHCAANNVTPHSQGLLAMFEIFLDTVVMCTITGLVILVCGQYNPAAYLSAQASGVLLPDGTALVSNCFDVVIPMGGAFVAVSIVVFAFCTLLCWSYYGETVLRYLCGGRFITMYRIVFGIFIFIGCLGSTDVVWMISDLANCMMAVPNLFAIFLLRKQIYIKNND